VISLILPPDLTLNSPEYLWAGKEPPFLDFFGPNQSPPPRIHPSLSSSPPRSRAYTVLASSLYAFELPSQGSLRRSYPFRGEPRPRTFLCSRRIVRQRIRWFPYFVDNLPEPRYGSCDFRSLLLAPRRLDPGDRLPASSRTAPKFFSLASSPPHRRARFAVPSILYIPVANL